MPLRGTRVGPDQPKQLGCNVLQKPLLQISGLSVPFRTLWLLSLVKPLLPPCMACLKLVSPQPSCFGRTEGITEAHSTRSVCYVQELPQEGPYTARCDLVRAWADFKIAFAEAQELPIPELMKQAGTVDKVLELRTTVPAQGVEDWMFEELDVKEMDDALAKWKLEIRTFLQEDLKTRTAKLHSLRNGAPESRSWKEGLAPGCSWEDLVQASTPLRKSAELFQAYTGLVKACSMSATLSQVLECSLASEDTHRLVDRNRVLISGSGMGKNI